MNIFEKMAIEFDCLRGEIEFNRQLRKTEREFKRNCREAGKNNTPNQKVNDDSAKESATPVEEVTEPEKNVKTTESKNIETAEPKDSETIEAENEAPVEEADAHINNDGEPSETPTSAEAPQTKESAGEEAGVHINETPVTGEVTAPMKGVPDVTPNILGVDFSFITEPDSNNTENPDASQENNANTNMVFNIDTNPCGGNFSCNPYLEYQQQQSQIQQTPPGFGRHKQDFAKPAEVTPVVEQPKAPEIEVSIPKIAEPQEKPKPTVPEILPKSDVIPTVVEENNQPAQPFYDNSEIFSKYPTMREVENLALNCGANINIKFVERMPNILDVYVFNADTNTLICEKCFTIELGQIIDRRQKIWPGVYKHFEGRQSYPLQIPKKEEKDKENNKKTGNNKGKNVLNEKALKDIFIGGINTLDPRGMYSPEFQRLNTYVALITLPMNQIHSKEERKRIQDLLMRGMQSGVFDAARRNNPGCRFRIESYNKADGSFVLTSQGVPMHFGDPTTYYNGPEQRIKVLNAEKDNFILNPSEA